jgi:hypothetical protein
MLPGSGWSVFGNELKLGRYLQPIGIRVADHEEKVLAGTMASGTPIEQDVSFG